MAGLASWLGWLAVKADARGGQERDSIRRDLLSALEKKDDRIRELEIEYRALAESYIRDTGKVFIRPVPQQPDRMPPPQPSAFKMRPPPPWTDPKRQQPDKMEGRL